MALNHLLRFRLSDDELPSSWQAALTVCGGIGIGLAVLAFLYLTKPLGVALYDLAHHAIDLTGGAK